MSVHQEYWVHFVEGQWAVRHNGATVSCHLSKYAAIEVATDAAHANPPSLLVICREDTRIDSTRVFGAG